MLTLILQFGPWILTALAGVAALLTHWNAKAEVAAAGQKVAEAQTGAAQARTQTAEVRDTEAQANAAAAQAGAQAVKEGANVENETAGMSDGAVRDSLFSDWSRPGESAGRGAASGGSNPND
ncbi:hypothetical protein [Paraburkholderia caledonica]|jgi:hypothetical protein|uniref:hypothetical protein n=1 Tax=Paraburkholderia caledonica TaxID=134536 RepID=UPI0038BB7CBA